MVERVRWNAKGYPAGVKRAVLDERETGTGSEQGMRNRVGTGYEKLVHGITMPADKLNEGAKTIALEEDPCAVQVPSQFRCSYTGRLMQVTHALLVELTTAS